MQTINFIENLAKSTHHNLVNEALLIQQSEEVKKAFSENDQRSLREYFGLNDEFAANPVAVFLAN